MPPPAAVAAAQRSLMAFALTISPEALMAALPSYLGSETTPHVAQGLDSPEEADSNFALQAARFLDCKNCWQILKEDFIRPLGKESGSTGTNSRGRRKTLDAESQPTSVVGSNAWPVLDWLVTLFEKDEENAETNGKRD